MGAYTNNQLFKVLAELEIIDKKILEQSLAQSNESHLPLGELLLEKDLIKQNSLGKIVGDLIGKPSINLAEVSIDDEILKIIPEVVAQKQHVISFRVDKKGLHIATDDPSHEQLFDFLTKKTGLPVIVYYASFFAIKQAASQYAKKITQAFDDIIAENVAQAKGSINADPPIIKIVDTIITYAYQNSASDVHIEPLDDKTLVRFRIDGILHDIVELPLELDTQIVTRIKVMANLRTDEHQETQDGKILFQAPDESLDIRVSIAPLTRGEKIVMRLLSERSRQFSLADLGFSGDDLKKVEQAYAAPHGMILSTGPTGSGKTTTLYAILKLINRREINVMTIEDPVEYQMEHVNQIQVNPKTDLTFAKGLRSIVRQDPDVILVGEIRDEETASIAINSAMTGHLVLSTLHTNDAATTFPRLIDMEVEPYLIASTVNVVIAQRLVRKICPSCKVSEEIEFEKLDEQVKPHVKTGEKLLTYKGKGCSVCHTTGYSGRIGIFEVMIVNEALRTAIAAKNTAAQLHALAVEQGMRTMMEDGIEKIKQGITTLEEVLRVTKE